MGKITAGIVQHRKASLLLINNNNNCDDSSKILRTSLQLKSATSSYIDYIKLAQKISVASQCKAHQSLNELRKLALEDLCRAELREHIEQEEWQKECLGLYMEPARHPTRSRRAAGHPGMPALVEK